jgi:hypothetical protein
MPQVMTAFYTEAHRIEGELVLSERLSEKLNDPLTDYIELRHARITSLLHDSGSPAMKWPVATIPKRTILVATLDAEEHESRQTRIDKVQSKQGSEVGAVVGSIEVYGTGHLQFSGAPTQVLTTQLQPYFPVTDATILLSQRQGDNRIATGLALVNRSMVRAFTLT